MEENVTVTSVSIREASNGYIVSVWDSNDEEEDFVFKDIEDVLRHIKTIFE